MNYAVKQRLRLIDFLLKHHGTVGRAELTDFFGISEPQATRDIKEYSKFAPRNALYNKHNRQWVRADTFKSAF